MSIAGKQSLTVTASGLPMPVTVSNVTWNGLSFKSSGTLFGQSYTATGTASGNNITGESPPPQLIPLACAPSYPVPLTSPQAEFATPALPPCAVTSTELPNKHPIAHPQPRALFAPAIKRPALLRHALAPKFLAVCANCNANERGL